MSKDKEGYTALAEMIDRSLVEAGVIEEGDSLMPVAKDVNKERKQGLMDAIATFYENNGGKK